jgi:hypothetical protein
MRKCLKQRTAFIMCASPSREVFSELERIMNINQRNRIDQRTRWWSVLRWFLRCKKPTFSLWSGGRIGDLASERQEMGRCGLRVSFG